MEHNVVLTMRGITMTFPGVKALDNVDLTLRKGEIMALMGRKWCREIYTDQVSDRNQRVRCGRNTR